MSLRSSQPYRCSLVGTVRPFCLRWVVRLGAPRRYPRVPPWTSSRTHRARPTVGPHTGPRPDRRALAHLGLRSHSGTLSECARLDWQMHRRAAVRSCSPLPFAQVRASISPYEDHPTGGLCVSTVPVIVLPRTTRIRYGRGQGRGQTPNGDSFGDNSGTEGQRVPRSGTDCPGAELISSSTHAGPGGIAMSIEPRSGAGAHPPGPKVHEPIGRRRAAHPHPICSTVPPGTTCPHANFAVRSECRPAAGVLRVGRVMHRRRSAPTRSR